MALPSDEPGPHVLDDPVRSSLDGVHAALADRRGRVARYHPEVGPFGSVPPDATARDWADLAELAGSGVVVLTPVDPPPGWRVLRTFRLTQMTLPPDVASLGGRGSADGVVGLGPDDVDEMMRLVELTRPGPFGRRTVELGRYLGVRWDGRLVAMAGERLRPEGWTEVSAVCTAPEARAHGLARLLVLELVRGIRARGGGVLLHVTRENIGAHAAYVRMGFVDRRELVATVLAPS